MSETNSGASFRNNVSASLRKKILEKYSNLCVICGASGDVVPLQFAALWPLSRGGEAIEENVVLLCPACHNTFDRRPKEIEFVSFLVGLLRVHPKYLDVVQEPIIGRETRVRPDVLARRRSSAGTEAVLIECKMSPDPTRVAEGVSQLQKYQAHFGECRLVFAVPATVSMLQRDILTRANIEVWDLDSLASTFAPQIRESPPSYFRALFMIRLGRGSTTTVEQKLLNDLKATEPGKKDWDVYQKVVGDILEALLSPPLGKPLSEHSDRSLANRRDFILPNYADKGFWLFMREKYTADYIVVDAKNSLE